MTRPAAIVTTATRLVENDGLSREAAIAKACTKVACSEGDKETARRIWSAMEKKQ